MRVNGTFFSVFQLKNHFERRPLQRSIYNHAYPYWKPAKGEKGVHCQQFAKQTLG